MQISVTLVGVAIIIIIIVKVVAIINKLHVINCHIRGIAISSHGGCAHNYRLDLNVVYLRFIAPYLLEALLSSSLVLGDLVVHLLNVDRHLHQSVS